MIRIRKLCKSFDGNKVLDNLDLDIRDQELLVIVGKSGCGKSVLIKHIIGLLKPDSGEIYLGDYDMTQLTGPSLYRALKNVSMIFQMGALFDSMSVMQNVGFYLYEHQTRAGKKIKKSDIKGFVEEALKNVGLEGILNLYPSDLSGGMKKRVSIARGIVSRPDYYFYDEPTTGLDPVTATATGELILSLQQELKGTTVVVSHDIATTLMIADRIALLENGKIEVVADPLTFMKHDHPTIRHFNTIIGHDYSLIRSKA